MNSFVLFRIRRPSFEHVGFLTAAAPVAMQSIACRRRSTDEGNITYACMCVKKVVQQALYLSALSPVWKPVWLMVSGRSAERDMAARQGAKVMMNIIAALIV